MHVCMHVCAYAFLVIFSRFSRTGLSSPPWRRSRRELSNGGTPVSNGRLCADLWPEMCLHWDVGWGEGSGAEGQGILGLTIKQLNSYALICTRACIYACVRARMRASIHACIYACMHINVHAYMHACINACTLCMLCMHACIYACTHMCAFECIYACMQAYMHTCMHICMHA